MAELGAKAGLEAKPRDGNAPIVRLNRDLVVRAAKSHRDWRDGVVDRGRNFPACTSFPRCGSLIGTTRKTIQNGDGI